MTAPLAAPRAADVLADVVVVGGGIVGLAVAARLADHNLSVTLLTTKRLGAASRAAAGLLVPHYSGHSAAPALGRFMTDARDLYPSYVRWVEERAEATIPFQASGAIEFARSPSDCAALQRAAPADAELLTPAALGELEPALGPTAGGLLYPRDGAVDNVRITEGLASIVARHSRTRTVCEPASRLDLRGPAPIVVGATGTRVQGSHIVLAAGAWTGLLGGLPRPIPVRPVRGQICALRTAPLRHVVLGPDAYMVGRGGERTLVGSTMEDVGFDASTTPAAIAALQRAAVTACPSLADQPVVDAWSGLRPATPDLLPIIGADPGHPTLIYACGHSRNGILLAPITAIATCTIVLGDAPDWDLTPFSIERFDRGPLRP